MSSLSRFIIKRFAKVHIFIYRLTGGRLFASFGRLSFLLLTTTGRNSGKPRTIPLLYIQDGDVIAVVASFAGAPVHPSWYLNLLKNPEASMRIGDRVIAVTASTAAAEDKDRLWPRFAAMYPDYDDYQRRTDRDIPVVLLSREAAP